MFVDHLDEINPDFFEYIDPDFYFDTENPGRSLGDEDEDIYDTFDSIIDDPDMESEDYADIFQNVDSYSEPNEETEVSDEEIFGLREEGLALALAFGEGIKNPGEFLNEIKNSKYDMNENTDRKNMEEALSLNNRLYGSKKLRPFERHVQGYIASSRLF